MRRMRKTSKKTEEDKFAKLAEAEVRRKEKAAQAATKTLAEILNDEVKKVYVPALDINVEYRDLSLGDFAEFSKLKELTDPEQRVTFAHKLLMKTWGKADSTVTEEKLNTLSLSKCMAIIEAIGGVVFTEAPLPQSSTPSKPPLTPAKAN